MGVERSSISSLNRVVIFKKLLVIFKKIEHAKLLVALHYIYMFLLILETHKKTIE